MTDKIKIPYNDVFFYGVSLNSRDISDVKTDIFANILMRYLRTLKPVSSKLYRVADGNKFEYNYSFIPTKPLYWRVIKNRRVIEETEQLTDGKYCLNYYDDQGRDLKCVLFSNQHKWQKTNYYNAINSSSLFCSLVPKEINGETVILQYITGEAYPVTLYCCPAASCPEVMSKVLSRVPTPEVNALTNYGVLYFAQKETLNIYNQVLKEEEEAYSELHKPEIFTTNEDVAGGFCFDVSSFDSTQAVGAMFDLSEAAELSDEGFDTPVADESVTQASEISDKATQVGSDTSAQPVAESENGSDEYSLEADISEAIRLISDATAVQIDENVVFSNADSQSSAFESFSDEESDEETDNTSFDDSGLLSEDARIVSDDISTTEVTETTTDKDIDSFVISGGVADSSTSATDVDQEPLTETSSSEAVPQITESTVETSDSVDLLTMNDDAIDDYVQTLIDSLLLDAKTLAEYKDSADNAFTAGGTEAAVKDDIQSTKSVQDLLQTPADSLIESNGAQYFYYGETDSSGQRCGRGKTLMSDGKTAYDGEYKDDMRHGQGSFYYKDGTLCYWGDWSRNMRNGFGLGISSETGTVHTGGWSNNKPVGIGVRFDKDGNFMYIDSACHRTNGGIRITAFTEKSFTVEYWDENTLKTVKKEIFIDDLF